MNYIFIFLILLAFIFGAINGTLDAVVASLFTSARHAVEICLSLIGIMAFWLGIMKIAQKTGLTQKFAKFISPVTKKIFNEIPPDSPAISDIALNFSANALGLSNASTPFGIKAMENLAAEEEKKNKGWDKISATNSMCVLLAINTAGIPAIPTSVMGILSALGSKNPTEIMLPALIVGTITFICAIFIAKSLERWF